MPETICPVCGLPKPSLCVCGTIDKEAQRITVVMESRRFNKPTTIITGITGDVKDVLKQLKSKLACGGTFKEGRIELQGDHTHKIMDVLKKMGYDESQIDVTLSKPRKR